MEQQFRTTDIHKNMPLGCAFAAMGWNCRAAWRALKAGPQLDRRVSMHARLGMLAPGMLELSAIRKWRLATQFIEEQVRYEYPHVMYLGFACAVRFPCLRPHAVNRAHVEIARLVAAGWQDPWLGWRLDERFAGKLYVSARGMLPYWDSTGHDFRAIARFAGHEMSHIWDGDVIRSRAERIMEHVSPQPICPLGWTAVAAKMAPVARVTDECPVCMEPTAPFVQMLACGHTICDSCARALMALGAIKCPMCRGIATCGLVVPGMMPPIPEMRRGPTVEYAAGLPWRAARRHILRCTPDAGTMVVMGDIWNDTLAEVAITDESKTNTYCVLGMDETHIWFAGVLHGRVFTKAPHRPVCVWRTLARLKFIDE